MGLNSFRDYVKHFLAADLRRGFKDLYVWLRRLENRIMFKLGSESERASLSFQGVDMGMGTECLPICSNCTQSIPL